MARPLSVASNGKYAQADVQNAMLAADGRASGRFDLYDNNMNYVGPLNGVSAATISFDRSRPIPGLLKLTMTPTAHPDTRPEDAWDHSFLRDKPFQYYVKAWAQFGPMPDSGLAEFPMGVYCWQRPARHIEGTPAAPWPGSEVWDVDLPDLTYLLNVDGPGDPDFTLYEGTDIQTCIVLVLRQVGIFEQGGVAWTPFTLPTTMTFFFWKTFSDIFQTGEAGRNQVEGAAENWLNILTGLHKVTAFSPPWMNLDGTYQAHFDPILDIGPPDVIYDTATTSTVLLPVDSAPDNSIIANRIFAVSDSGDGTQLTAIIDLNDWVPNHPLAQRNTKHYISVPYSVPGVPSYEALYVSGLVELARRLSMYEKYTLTTVGFNALHEADELVAVRIDNDPELASTVPLSLGGVPLPPDAAALFPPDWQYHLFQEVGWTYDFFGGEMQHTISRYWRTF